MIYCPDCGVKLPCNENFCPNCGLKTAAEEKTDKNGKANRAWLFSVAVIFAGLILFYASWVFLFKNKTENKMGGPKEDFGKTAASTKRGDKPFILSEDIQIKSFDITSFPNIKVYLWSSEFEDIDISDLTAEVSENQIPIENPKFEFLQYGEYKTLCVKYFSGQGRTDQGRTDQGRTDQGRTDQGRTDQGRTDQDSAGQGSADQPPADQEDLKVNAKLSISGKEIEYEYKAPLQRNIIISDVAYNTDNYPEVQIYFSFKEPDRADRADGNILNILFEDPQFYKFKESGKEILGYSISKVADPNESLSLNLVIDNSLGMDQDNKISRVTDAARNLVANMDMNSGDRIALMTFSEPGLIRQTEFTTNRSDIQKEIYQITTGGSSRALYNALQQAVKSVANNGQTGSKFIIVFTGGKDSGSDVAADEVIKDALRLGVQIYALGAGEYPQLENIAQKTGGAYFDLGESLYNIYMVYQSVYENKKNQYMIKYQSLSGDQGPIDISISFDSPLYKTYLESVVKPSF